MTEELAVGPLAPLRFGRGEPVLLLHGFCGGADAWQPTLSHLARRHDVIAPDWPGFGRSRHLAPCPSIEAMAAHVVALADALGLDRFHVVGHSMSGFVVLELLLRHSARIGSAVLYGACLAMKTGGRFESAADTVDRIERQGVEAMVRHIVATWFAAGAAHPAFEPSVETGRLMSGDAAIAAMAACMDTDYTGRLADVRTRTLVVAGERDRTAPPETTLQLARALPGSSLCVLPDCAHAAHLERADLFNAVVAGFIDAGR